jgi:REP element-mobilizing transposase RayT
MPTGPAAGGFPPTPCGATCPPLTTSEAAPAPPHYHPHRLYRTLPGARNPTSGGHAGCPGAHATLQPRAPHLQACSTVLSTVALYGMLEVGATLANPCGDEGEDFAVLSFLENTVRACAYAYALHVHSMCTACAQHVHCMCTVHALRAHTHYMHALHRRKARAGYLTRPRSSAPPARVTEFTREMWEWRLAPAAAAAAPRHRCPEAPRLAPPCCPYGIRVDTGHGFVEHVCKNALIVSKYETKSLRSGITYICGALSRYVSAISCDICIRFHGGGRGVSHETRVWESASVPLRARLGPPSWARAAGGDLARPPVARIPVR